MMRFPLIQLGVPPCWRAYFLLLRQKKVAKEKATPGYAAGVAGSPALLEAGGACGTRPGGPQTVLGLFPPASPLLGAPHGDPKSVSAQRANAQSTDGLPGPLRGAEQRRNAGGSRLALSEPQASLASRALSDATHREEVLLGCPAFRVAQGTPAGGADPGVAFSLATFFWPHKRKYARPQGGTPSQLIQ
jgi:hypothetical protein